jgi:hypothetical protein
LPVLALLLAILGPLPGLLLPEVAAQSGETYYYRQITNIDQSVTGSVGLPVLSADGQVAAFADAPGTGDPATPNRVYRIAADGSGLAEVDSYTPKCFCGSWVDLSADGATIVSTDSVQIRVTTGGNGTTILEVSSNEISSLRLTASGDRMVFILGRDAAVVGSGEALVRGIYVLNVDGSGLQLVVGPEELAALAGTTADQIGMLRLQAQALDVSDDGSRSVFGAYIAGPQAVFAANIDGSGLVQLQRPVSYVQRVAISGDGASVAMDVVPIETQLSEVSVVPFAGGPSSVLIPGLPTNQVDPIQLTQDGSKLLVSPSALLVDTASNAVTQLSTPIEGLGGAHEAVIQDGLPRATMDATATIVLYAMRTVKCADCANLSEQLAVLTFGEPPPGAPAIANVTIDPTSVVLGDYEDTFAISAEVTTTDGEPLGVGFSGILPSGAIDTNFGSTTRLADDATLGDAAAGDETFTQTRIVYVVRTAAEPGPRLIRVAAEIETADGYRIATAVDAGTIELTPA